MNNTCANPNRDCNCDKNDNEWREDSGLLTDKTKLPVIQLRFGDTGDDIFKEEALDEKMDLMIFASKTNLRQIWRQICPPIKCPKCETNLLSHLSRRNMRQMWFKYAIIFALVQRYLKQDKYEDK